MNAPSLHFGYEGLYQLEKRKVLGIDADGEQILSEPEVILPWFHNLITDKGLDEIEINGNQLAACRIGTGNATPNVTDQFLQTQVGATTTAGTGNDVTGVAVDNSYIYTRKSRRFAAGTIAGLNLSEVAMAREVGAATPVFSRALLTDALGNPLTIVLLPDEVLDVVYELRLYITNADTVVNVTIDGAPATVTMRPHTWPNGTAWLGKANNIGNGIFPSHLAGGTGTMGSYENQNAIGVGYGNAGTGNTGAASTYKAAYVAGSRTRTMTVNVGLTVANYATGIGAFVLSSNGSWWTDAAPPGEWSWGFNPKLFKNNNRVARIIVGFTWGRHAP